MQTVDAGFRSRVVLDCQNFCFRRVGGGFSSKAPLYIVLRFPSACPEARRRISGGAVISTTFVEL